MFEKNPTLKEIVIAFVDQLVHVHHSPVVTVIKEQLLVSDGTRLLQNGCGATTYVNLLTGFTSSFTALVSACQGFELE